MPNAYIHPEHIATVLPIYQALIEQTQQEPGCASYELFHDIKELGHFVFIETWLDRAALDAHVQTIHFQTLVPEIDQYTIKNARFTHLQPLTQLISTDHAKV